MVVYGASFRLGMGQWLAHTVIPTDRDSGHPNSGFEVALGILSILANQSERKKHADKDEPVPVYINHPCTYSTDQLPVTWSHLTVSSILL